MATGGALGLSVCRAAERGTSLAASLSPSPTTRTLTTLMVERGGSHDVKTLPHTIQKENTGSSHQHAVSVRFSEINNTVKEILIKLKLIHNSRLNHYMQPDVTIRMDGYLTLDQ